MADSWSNSFERVINRAIGEEIGESAFAASVGLERAWNKRVLRTGTQVEQPIFTGEDGTATMFSIHGMDSAGVSGTVTFKEPDKLINLIIPFKPAGDTIRFSEIRMKMAAGNKTELYNYFRTQASLFKLSIMKLLGQQFVAGDPDGTSTDVHGLASIFKVAASNAGVSYQSQARTQSDALFPSIFCADATTTAYATGSASIADGGRVITGTNTSWASSIFEGDKITLGTQTFTVRAVVSATSLHVTPAADGASGTVSFTHSPQFSDTTTYAASGVINLAKIDKAYWDCTDGPFEPTVMFTRGDMFGAIASRLVANQRYASQDNKVGIKKRQSFMYNNAELFIDNYVPSGTIYGLNEEFFNCYAVQGLDQIKLVEGSLQRDYSSFQRASFVAEVNVALNFSTKAPNRNFKIDGFTV
jgi:hypothetical protein